MQDACDTQTVGQRYIDTCENIREKRDYIIQNLDANITINVNNFFNDLSTDDLDKIEEALQNIRSAVKSEQTRRQLDERIKKIRDKKRQKLKKKTRFDLYKENQPIITSDALSFTYKNFNYQERRLCRRYKSVVMNDIENCAEKCDIAKALSKDCKWL